jgi:N-acetylglucosamine malate deacetylase 1
MNILLIGAHPDDSEVVAGGTIALWQKAGFKVTIASMTNGDKGHQTLNGAELATCRKEESLRSASLVNAQSIVFDIPDGELEPTLAVRKQVVRMIRECKAGLVITHRPNDYHPDHRYTSQVVQDAAYMVTVPQFEPDVPALRDNPVFMYFMDHFQRPYPFQPDVAVDVDAVMDIKWKLFDAMDSQFYEWLPWHMKTLDTLPEDAEARLAWLEDQWGPLLSGITEQLRPALNQWYSESHTASVRYAECYELSEYGHQPTRDDLVKLFPFLD